MTNTRGGEIPSKTIVIKFLDNGQMTENSIPVCSALFLETSYFVNKEKSMNNFYTGSPKKYTEFINPSKNVNSRKKSLKNFVQQICDRNLHSS